MRSKITIALFIFIILSVVSFILLPSFANVEKNIYQSMNTEVLCQDVVSGKYKGEYTFK